MWQKCTNYAYASSLVAHVGVAVTLAGHAVASVGASGGAIVAVCALFTRQPLVSDRTLALLHGHRKAKLRVVIV